MNKGELVEFLVEKAKLSKAEAGRVLDTVIEGIQHGPKKTKEVALIGFGTFKVVDRAAREGRNPKTGEKIKIAAKRAVSFKAGKGLKDIVAK